MKKFIKLALILVALNASNAYACVITYRTASELKAEATVVVLATVTSAKVASTSFRGSVYAYEIDVASAKKGSVNKKLTKATYESIVAHKRGQVTVCPHRNGSGIEQGLKVNSRYRLFLRSEKDPEILLAESGDKPSEIVYPFIPTQPQQSYSFLLDAGQLYEGVSVEQAKIYLGEPTSISENRLSWSHNHKGWHVFPYIGATLKGGNLYEWHSANLP